MSEFILKKQVGSDGNYQIIKDEKYVFVSCDFLFDDTTGERTQIYLKFDVVSFHHTLDLLQSSGECIVKGNDNSFLKLKKNNNTINIHFGREGSDQFVIDEDISEIITLFK